MAKARQSNKESKKAPVLSLKEKRVARKTKAGTKDAIVPFVTPRPK